ncbi:hypothetical protein LOTGIDRAFT_165441 [Lottia gigantea]|uniref:Uncharacterized protein n=1 Tax=Lottia gigantea TaxID=225164 RepID=V4A5V1_LOTGI|nr:hypothetical protein LOTGIDRAFT_165441 [Lottia gigantea]ESO88656.1 hypothetical protein LOTGIDRAFT_165441 [Lottia gigantea]
MAIYSHIIMWAFKKCGTQFLRRWSSGTEEEYTERDALLTDLVDLIEESNAEISSTKDKRDEERQKELKGVMIREAAMQSLKRNTPHVESGDESFNQKEKETPKKKTEKQYVRGLHET